jgi:hypothetical protein
MRDAVAHPQAALKWGMQVMEPARSADQRKSDALRRLREDKDLWIATADPSGTPCLVPLCFYWDDASIFVATVVTNPTARNIIKTGTTRVALGHTRDVVLIMGTARLLQPDEMSSVMVEAYKQKSGWDPLESAGYRFLQIVPQWVESWRELNEHPDRQLMSDRRWLV